MNEQRLNIDGNMEDNPHTFLVPDTEWAFIHITKTGGTSVRRYLKMPNEKKAEGKKHMTGQDIQATVSPQRFSEFRFFTVVREPFDRMQSYWKYRMRKRAAAGKERIPFDQWLLKLVELPIQNNSRRTQAHYLQANGTFLPNVHILRFEHLESELTGFAQAHHLKTLKAFPHANPSAVPEGFDGGYTPAMRDLVREMFEEDFERFGYPLYP